MNTHTVTIDEPDAGQRLDKCLAGLLPEFSRSRIQQLIDQGCVRLGSATITDATRKVKPGDIYSITPPAPVETHLRATAMALNILFEDKDFLVIDKPAGMTVHPAPGHADDTLVNALLAHCGDSLSGIGGVMRPGIVHRIDKDTSGLLVVAKNDIAHRNLAAQIVKRSLKREYLAVVRGIPKPAKGTIEGAIGRSRMNRKKMAVVKSGGKEAKTYYQTEEILNGYALLRCQLDTGRTHQIRVHLTHIGYPLVGDPVYGRGGKALDFPRQALHAASLTLQHPKTGKKMQFHSPIPQDMEQLLASLRGA
jgi:23S rRNA pseudouridine1911/1915/1917 synthase